MDDPVTDTISGWVQVYRHKRAVFEGLRSFRTHYKTEPITVVSDDGDDFTEICEAFNAKYVHEHVRTVVGPPEQRTLNRMTLDGIHIFFRRVYDHCVSTDTDWVVILGPDVRTIRRIREFPKTPIAGARRNPFSPELTDHLIRNFGYKDYVYGAAGGSIFSRRAFIEAYEGNRNIGDYVKYDDRVALYDDLALGLLFFINNFDYSVWDDVSEILHESYPVIRDSAFDHGYKYWYDKDFDESLLTEVDSY